MIGRSFLAALALAGAASAATAQQTGERPFCADRPGKGTPTCILDVGRWQAEVGLVDGARQSDAGSRLESEAWGDLFLRYGLTPLTELQFGLTTWTREAVTDKTTGNRDVVDGVSDLQIGFRHSLANPDGSGVSIALAGFITAPTGSRDLRADGFEGGVVVPISLPLNDDWGLSLSPGVDIVADSDGDGRHAAYTMVAGIGRGFGPWALGAEIWISRDDDPIEPTTQSTFDLTAVWSPPAMPDAQLDFGLNFGLNDDSPDVEFGVGVARRF
ncbi:MAG: transporter [Caulobacteraceae bacterium]|nr:transporter [Caulobacteraceae bacterium]